MPFFDLGYLIWVFIPTLIISFAAQAYLKSQFNKWNQVRNSHNLNGAEVGRLIIERTTLGDKSYGGGRGAPAGLASAGTMASPFRQASVGNAAGIRLEYVEGQLSDHYDPTSHTVRMSHDVATQPSVMAMAVVAHELGHAEQHEANSLLIQMRNFLLPALQFAPMGSYILIMIGLFLNITGALQLGVLLFGIMVLFSILTLPVEIDASKRGLRLLREANLLSTEQDATGARSMLTAAAMTYIAAAVTSVLTLVYYLSLLRGSDE